MKRIYGIGIFVTQLNAKELALKKINADQNWIDIYCIAVILGDKFEDVGRLMISPEVSSVISEFNNSVFQGERSQNKLTFLESKISEYETLLRTANEEDAHRIKDKIDKINKLKKYAEEAEELRIMGKMLKINQGLPVKISEQYTYVRSIEQYIEKKLNKRLIENFNKAKGDLMKAVFENKVYNGDWSKVKSQLDAFEQATKEMNDNWRAFNLIEFIDSYATNGTYHIAFIEEYKKIKENFNILDTISSVSHFREMYKSLSVLKKVLNELSVRNNFINTFLDSKKPVITLGGKNQIIYEDKTSKFNETQLRNILSDIDEFIIRKFLDSKKYEIRHNGKTIELDGSFDKISGFKKFIEEIFIPELKVDGQLKNNEFIKNLTFSVKNTRRKLKDNSEEVVKEVFYKLPINLTQADSTIKTKNVYNEILQAFNKLNGKTLSLNGIEDSHSITDLFYLYNLVVNRDKFGPNSMTRIFEDIVTSNEESISKEFNEWIDAQDDINLSE